MMGDEPESNLLTPGLGKPARRALAAAGYTRLEQLTEVGEAEVMGMHGMGPRALDHLRRALAARGRSFADSSHSVLRTQHGGGYRDAKKGMDDE